MSKLLMIHHSHPTFILPSVAVIPYVKTHCSSPWLDNPRQDGWKWCSMETVASSCLGCIWCGWWRACFFSLSASQHFWKLRGPELCMSCIYKKKCKALGCPLSAIEDTAEHNAKTLFIPMLPPTLSVNFAQWLNFANLAMCPLVKR